MCREFDRDVIMKTLLRVLFADWDDPQSLLALTERSAINLPVEAIHEIPERL